VTGYETSNIYKYDNRDNKFSVFINYLNTNVYKYLIEKFLVCFGNCLYEINETGNLIKRQSLGDSGSYLNSSAYFKRGINLYFITYGPKLYRINTESKTIELVNIT
jgi:hypothetical protein